MFIVYTQNVPIQFTFFGTLLSTGFTFTLLQSLGPFIKINIVLGSKMNNVGLVIAAYALCIVPFKVTPTRHNALITNEAVIHIMETGHNSSLKLCHLHHYCLLFLRDNS